MRPEPTTADSNYTERLITLSDPLWKRILNVQAPYRWNLRRLKLGFTLDIGCGLGRNLAHLGGGVGIDHNPHSVEVARSRGQKAYLPEDFDKSEFNCPSRFDSILLAHVVEHMTQVEAIALLGKYLPLLKKDGRVVLIAPQEAGYKSDHTHVQFTDFDGLRRIGQENRLTHLQQYSFPFPRLVGRFFKYNEFVSISVKQ